MNIERPDIADMNELRREYYQLREFPDSIIPKNARNQWPSKLPDFQSAAADYFDLAQAVSMQLIAHVCAGLNLPKQVTDTLLGFHNLNDSNLEYKRYPGKHRIPGTNARGLTLRTIQEFLNRCSRRVVIFGSRHTWMHPR